MGAPFILTLLSSDGYQVFAALHREYATIDEAVEGPRTTTFGGTAETPHSGSITPSGMGRASGTL